MGPETASLIRSGGPHLECGAGVHMEHNLEAGPPFVLFPKPSLKAQGWADGSKSQAQAFRCRFLAGMQEVSCGAQRILFCVALQVPRICIPLGTCCCREIKNFLHV